MYKFLKAACLIVLIALAAGCVSLGKDFARPDPDKFKLGQTTYAEVVQLMGGVQKFGKHESWVNDKLVKSLVYFYTQNAVSLVPGVSSPERSMVFCFYNDVLVSHSYWSSFQADSTNFDDTKIDQIIKGKTSLAEVIQIFGKPNSFKIPPMIKDTVVKEVGYYYSEQSHSNGDLKLFTKELKISLDDKDIVTNVEFQQRTL